MTRGFTLLLLGVFISSGAHSIDHEGEYVSSGNWGSSRIKYGSRADTYTSIDFIRVSIDFTASDCSKPALMIHLSSFAKISDIGKSATLSQNTKVRVDEGSIWNSDNLYFHVRESDDGKSAVGVYGTPLGSELLNEIRGGNTLRIKMGDPPAFRASLSGARSAIDRASALCQKAANSSKNHGGNYERVAPNADDDSYFK